MADQIPDTIFREIDEELRHEQLAKLWKRYGHYAIGAAVALVIAVAGYQGWRTYDLNTRTAESERFAAALRLAGGDNVEAAQAALSLLAAEAGRGYSLLARFEAAALAARGDDVRAAAAAYRAIADDTGVPALYRDLAVLLGAMAELSAGPAADPAGLRARLAPLTVHDNPWQFGARELTALLARQQGEIDKAKELFAALAADAAAPAGVRARANEMVQGLGQ